MFRFPHNNNLCYYSIDSYPNEISLDEEKDKLTSFSSSSPSTPTSTPLTVQPEPLSSIKVAKSGEKKKKATKKLVSFTRREDTKKKKTLISASPAKGKQKTGKKIKKTQSTTKKAVVKAKSYKPPENKKRKIKKEIVPPPQKKIHSSTKTLANFAQQFLPAHHTPARKKLEDQRRLNEFE